MHGFGKWSGHQDCQEEEEEGETEIRGRADGAKDGEFNGVGIESVRLREGG